MMKFRWHDVAEILVGASVLAIPVAYTEEVWVLGEQLPWPNVWAVVASSVGFVALFVYFIYYKEKMERDKWHSLLCVMAGHGLTLLIAAVTLLMVQNCPWGSDPASALKRVIPVGYPASFSVIVLDSLR